MINRGLRTVYSHFPCFSPLVSRVVMLTFPTIAAAYDIAQPTSLLYLVRDDHFLFV